MSVNLGAGHAVCKCSFCWYAIGQRRVSERRPIYIDRCFAEIPLDVRATTANKRVNSLGADAGSGVPCFSGPADATAIIAGLRRRGRRVRTRKALKPHARCLTRRAAVTSYRRRVWSRGPPKMTRALTLSGTTKNKVAAVCMSW